MPFAPRAAPDERSLVASSRTTSRTSRSSTRKRSSDLRTPVARRAKWSDLDVRAVDTGRLLAVDAVQKVGNGHPGTAMSLSPAAYLLYQNVMRHDPSDPTWLGRDRFVLSCGHSSLTQYVQLFLSGYGLELDDLKSLRTWGSLTPGHPEVNHTPGVEITTGPLGSGLASAVGMAAAQRRERGLLDPDAKPGESPFDHHVWVIASDGDLQEGVSAEASSFAGHQQLGNLTVIYDQNQISIEDDTDISFSEDVALRYEAYGWQVITVDWRADAADGQGGHDYVENVDALLAACEKSRRTRTKPTLIVLRTIIAWPAPTKQDTGKSHGSALGADEIAATKELLGFDPAKDFQADRAVLAHTRKVVKRGKKAHADWDKALRRWRKKNPERSALLDRLVAGELPDGLRDALPTFEPDEKGIATRAASGKVLGALAPVMPELWGGSADLAESNNTTMVGEPSFIPVGKQTRTWKGGPYGRTLHFGIRENGMGMILNGIALSGLTRPYGGTFLVFSDYMRPAVRLAAIQQLPVTYVWTHDSIGLGEDGPTHQPIEHLASLRAMPGLDVVRPADANETAAAWAQILENGATAGLALSRQGLPILDRTEYADTSGVAKGAYVLAEASTGSPEVLLIATGSEVHVALEARATLEKAGTPTRVVSMPCREWFEKQPKRYQDEVLPPEVRARVSVEAGVAQGWREIVGDHGRSVSIEHFGASADAATLFREFGFSPKDVVKAARDSLKAVAKAGAAVPGVTATAPRSVVDTGTDRPAPGDVPMSQMAGGESGPVGSATQSSADAEQKTTATKKASKTAEKATAKKATAEKASSKKTAKKAASKKAAKAATKGSGSTRSAVLALADAGVSVWLDDLSRTRISGGDLARAVEETGVVGVTTNPSIFQAALAEGEAYTDQLTELVRGGADVDAAVTAMTTEDVRNACDVLMPVHDRSEGVDGRVSIEVDPRLAHDTEGTIAQAKELWEAIDRPNLLVKIPATVEGLPAITETLAAGISVNVTLIFSLERYREVMNAFLQGLERARTAGHDLSTIHSVASFFVSRVDTEIDSRLEAIGTDEALALRGKAGLANARLAYEAYEEVFSTPRWANLADAGARPQRPLWASTGVKNPDYPDTMYVTELVAPGTVNTMPEKTLLAVTDHGEVDGDTISGTYEESTRVLDAIERLGIGYDEVTAQLEREGVAKFEDAWGELLEGVRTEMRKVKG